jgi:hypothetical protein
MNDERARPKIEERDGKLFVEGEKDPYIRGMIRHLNLSGTELFLARSISYDADKKAAHASYKLAGKARLSDDSLCMIGEKDSLTKDLSLTLKPWPKEEPTLPGDKAGH